MPEFNVQSKGLMTAGQWQRVKDAFETARHLSATGRDAYLHALAASDPEITPEVRSLLASYRDSETFLGTAAMHQSAGENLASAGLTLTGNRLGAYRVGPLIGVGGMGEVYTGDRDDGEFSQRVAIKVVRGASDSASVSRFRAERQILAGLSHPNIARLYDGGTTQAGSPYFVMEYIEGQRIDEYCRARDLADRERLRLFQQVCSAVEYAHQRGIIHRDLKPANIMVAEDGAPRLLDFGVAKLLDSGDAMPTATMTHMRACTPDYASPEQLRNYPLTPASDVYSLGAVLHEILSGTRFRGAPGKPSVKPRPIAPGLVRIVEKATHEDPSRRYASVAEFSAAIDKVLARGGRGRMLIAVAAALAIVAAGIVWWRLKAATRSGRTIGVIAIENLSQDPSLDWMDRGVSELLTTGLAQNGKLEVISTGQIRNLIGRRVKGEGKLPLAQARDVAADAHVDAFISGALLRIGSRLRLDVKVQDTSTGKVLFAHHVEGDDAQSVFRMADEAATLVAGQFAGATSGKAAAQDALTSNVEALKAYTEGMRFGQRFLMAQAMGSMRKAIALDPKFAMAHYRIAEMRGPWNPQLCRSETQQAMSIAESLSLPQTQKLKIRGLYLMCSEQFEDAKKIAQSIAAEAPHDPESWIVLQSAAFIAGDFAAAREAASHIPHIEAAGAATSGYDWFLKAYTGDYTAAIAASRAYNQTLDPGDINGLDLFGDTESMFGHLDEALRWYRQEDRFDKMGLTLLHQGRYDEAETEEKRDLARIPQGSPARGGRLGFLGDIEVGRGNLEGAVPYFEQGVQAYGSQLWFGADVMYKGSIVYLERGDYPGLLAFTDRLSNPWRSGFRAIAYLLGGKPTEADVEFAALRNSINPVMGDVAATLYEDLYRGTAAQYAHKPAEALDRLAKLPFLFQTVTALPMGRAYLETGDLAHAEEKLNLVLKTQYIWGVPVWYERQNFLALLLAHYYLGELSEKQGRKADAAAHYREFISHFAHPKGTLPQIAKAKTALARLR